MVAQLAREVAVCRGRVALPPKVSAYLFRLICYAEGAVVFRVRTARNSENPTFCQNREASQAETCKSNDCYIVIPKGIEWPHPLAEASVAVLHTLRGGDGSLSAKVTYVSSFVIPAARNVCVAVSHTFRGGDGSLSAKVVIPAA
jgi:hypothetical protein